MLVARSAGSWHLLRRQPAVPPASAAIARSGQDPGGLGPFITMDDPESERLHRARYQSRPRPSPVGFLHPELRFRIKEPGYSKIYRRVCHTRSDLKVTGPVTVRRRWKGILGAIRCDHAGDYGWRSRRLACSRSERKYTSPSKRTPDGLSPQDGAELSFFLRSAGFTR